MNDAANTQAQARFGTAGFGPTSLLMAQQVPPSPQPHISAPAPTQTRSKSRRTPDQPAAPAASGRTRLGVGVPADVFERANDVARQHQRTLADLVILGTELELAYGLAPDDAVATDLPIGKPRAAQTGLATMQVRMTAEQLEWLTSRAKQAKAVSLRQYAGAALTAYVRKHTS